MRRLVPRATLADMQARVHPRATLPGPDRSVDPRSTDSHASAGGRHRMFLFDVATVSACV